MSAASVVKITQGVPGLVLARQSTAISRALTLLGLCVDLHHWMTYSFKK